MLAHWGFGDDEVEDLIVSGAVAQAAGDDALELATMSELSTDKVVVTSADGITTITLAAPERLNAVDLGHARRRRRARSSPSARTRPPA